MKIKDTTNKQIAVFLLLLITLATSASLTTALFMKFDVSALYQVTGYFSIFVYHVCLMVALISIKTDDDKPIQQEFDFA
ncbi:hypothetical protein [Pseudomonas haemolytica]|jgi:hypothetical protein|uniref:Uncharacterized protein n=1 Tax=Pseudomonas haemolytica TaxID=2600065 RepID=A0ABS1H073_9PSED|nr:hypothetical protein [Pseudomonas haemolytica]MBK3462633.1 hypothetical protein [Pseudomonas haemolytica]